MTQPNERQPEGQEGFIDVDDALPSRFMKVRWLYTDGSPDVGVWNGKDFATWDASRELPIKSWKPL